MKSIKLLHKKFFINKCSAARDYISLRYNRGCSDNTPTILQYCYWTSIGTKIVMESGVPNNLFNLK